MSNAGSTMRRARVRARRLRATRLPDLQISLWALLTLRTVRNDLRQNGLRTTVPAPVRALPRRAVADVETTLKYLRATCLERSLIVQRVLFVQGRGFPVAVGVSHRDGEVAAHAWVVGFDDPRQGDGFTEITRLQPFE